MAIPAIYNTAYRYHSQAAHTDFNTTLSNLTAELVTNPATADKWTESPAGTFKSPPDSEGRFITMVAARIVATTLDCTFSDMNGITIAQRRIYCAAGGNEVRIWSGPYHIVIDSLQATPESMGAAMCDPSPASKKSTLNCSVIAWGHRTTAGTPSNTSTSELFRAPALGGTVGVNNAIVAYCQINGSVGTAVNQDGDNICWPVEPLSYDAGDSPRVMGRVYQMILTSTAPSIGDDVVISMDGVTTGTFKIIGRYQGGPAANRSIGVRKA